MFCQRHVFVLSKAYDLDYKSGILGWTRFPNQQELKISYGMRV